MRKIRFQRRVPGQRREALPASVEGELKDQVRKTASHFRVSRSWVVNYILCKAYGIKVESYVTDSGHLGLRRVK